MCLWENTGNYLTHLNIPVDEEVWFTREDVAKGEDTVVKRAMEWINNLAYAHNVSINKICAESSNDTVLVSAIVVNPNNDELLDLDELPLDHCAIYYGFNDIIKYSENDTIEIRMQLTHGDITLNQTRNFTIAKINIIL